MRAIEEMKDAMRDRQTGINPNFLLPMWYSLVVLTLRLLSACQRDECLLIHYNIIGACETSKTYLLGNQSVRSIESPDKESAWKSSRIDSICNVHFYWCEIKYVLLGFQKFQLGVLYIEHCIILPWKKISRLKEEEKERMDERKKGIKRERKEGGKEGREKRNTSRRPNQYHITHIYIHC